MAFKKRKMSRRWSHKAFRRGTRIHKRNRGHRAGAMRGGIRL